MGKNKKKLKKSEANHSTLVAAAAVGVLAALLGMLVFKRLSEPAPAQRAPSAPSAENIWKNAAPRAPAGPLQSKSRDVVLQDGFGKLDKLPASIEERLAEGLPGLEVSIGHDLVVNGKLKEASDAYRRAIVMNSENWEAYHWLAQLHSANKGLGDVPDIAERSLHVLLGVAPTPTHGAETHMRMSDLLFQQGRYTEALSHAKDATRVGGATPARLTNEAYLGVMTGGLGTRPRTGPVRMRCGIRALTVAGVAVDDEEELEQRMLLERAIKLRAVKLEHNQQQQQQPTSTRQQQPTSYGGALSLREKMSLCKTRTVHTSWIPPTRLTGEPPSPGVVSVEDVSAGGESYSVPGYEEPHEPPHCPNLDGITANEPKLRKYGAVPRLPLTFTEPTIQLVRLEGVRDVTRRQWT
jgi:tetratricopeptide (TPR) repeat protein